MTERLKNKTQILAEVLFVFLCGFIPVVVSQLSAERPVSRYIHIDNFRYGKDPSIIECNRGDTLHLTFSSRDAGHSFFLQEFDMDVKVSPGIDQVEQFHSSNPELPPRIVDTVVFVAEHPGLTKYLVSKSNFRCHVYCGPLHAFEAGSLVIGPNSLLNCGWGFLFGLFVVRIGKITQSLRSPTRSFELPDPNAGTDILNRIPRVKNLIKKNWFQPSLMMAGGVFLYVVLLTTLLGTKVSGRNLGVMLVWIVWLFLLISVLTPLGARLWCLMCPFPAIGEFLQRRAITRVRIGSTNGYRNQFFGLNLPAPRWLANGWPRLIAFLIAGTLSTTLVSQPIATCCAILAFTIVATSMPLIFRLRSFCQFVCPINTFVGTYSQVSPLSLRRVSGEVCRECKGDFCEKGSHTGWPCPYDLNVRTIDTNFTCGMCTECIRSCVYDNVTFRWRKFGSETVTREASLGWTAMAMLVIGIAYSVVYLGHWSRIRDYIDIVDRGNWGLFAIYAAALWTSALVIFPSLMYAVTLISKKLSGANQRTFDLMVASTGALLPLGLFVWIAFSIQMLFVNFTFVEQSLNDPFGWGWNLLGLAGIPWVQIVPQLVPWLQVAAVLTGFGFSFRNLWRIWLHKTRNETMAMKGSLPLASFILILTAALIQFYAN